jgi:hypothetical protein
MPRFVGESAVLGPRSRDHQRINASSINHGLILLLLSSETTPILQGSSVAGERVAGGVPGEGKPKKRQEVNLVAASLLTLQQGPPLVQFRAVITSELSNY